MKTRTNKRLAALALMSMAALSHAQPAPSLTREQQAGLDKQDQDIAQMADVIVKMIDQNKTGEVWDAGSAVAKKVISREDFVSKVTRDRAALGTPGMRMPMGVKHLHFDGTGNMPAGWFMSVSFDTQFSQARQSAREVVTFMLDPDRVWRFVGYSVR
jgi:hypothetical protein